MRGVLNSEERNGKDFFGEEPCVFVAYSVLIIAAAAGLQRCIFPVWARRSIFSCAGPERTFAAHRGNRRGAMQRFRPSSV